MQIAGYLPFDLNQYADRTLVLKMRIQRFFPRYFDALGCQSESVFFRPRNCVINPKLLYIMLHTPKMPN